MPPHTAALVSLEYWIILTTAVGGLLHGPLWLICACALALTFRSCVSDPHWLDRFRAIGKVHILALIWLEQLAVNHLFAAAAYALGFLAGWLWQVP